MPTSRYLAQNTKETKIVIKTTTTMMVMLPLTGAFTAKEKMMMKWTRIPTQP
jgi:hypothetical protein